MNWQLNAFDKAKFVNWDFRESENGKKNGGLSAFERPPFFKFYFKTVTKN